MPGHRDDAVDVEHRLDAGDGRVLFRRGDGEQAVEVREDAGLRWLQFGSGTIQSLMDTADPPQLVLPYTRAMMAPLLFRPAAGAALMLGLGGGSLARFLASHAQAAALTAIDHDRAVVGIARRFFELPPGVRVLVEDAREALGRLRERFALAFVDLFGADGMPTWVRTPDFHRLVAGRLDGRGVVATNLWTDDDDEFLSLIDGMREAFGGRVLVLPVTGYRNLVALGFASEPETLSLPALYATARRLRDATGLPFPALLDRIRDSNLTADNRLVL